MAVTSTVSIVFVAFAVGLHAVALVRAWVIPGGQVGTRRISGNESDDERAEKAKETHGVHSSGGSVSSTARRFASAYARKIE